MTSDSRIPSLTLPFGALGALTGWISTSAIQNPIFGAGRDLGRSVAAACGGLAAALIGAHLTGWIQAQITGFAEIAPARWARLAPLLVAAGVCTGIIVGSLAHAPWDGARLGLLCALLSFPLCAAVLRASERAGRARLGSLVRDTDRREVLGVVVLVAAIETLAELPGGLGWATVGTPGPWVAVAVALASMPVLFVLLRRDLGARRRLFAETRDIRERDHEQAPASHLPKLDLGIGDEVSARHARGATAYRDHDREIAFVIGSPSEAKIALDRAIRRGAVGLGISALVIAAHAISLGPWLRLPYTDALCKRRDFAGCMAQARLIAANDPVDPRIGPLFVHGCDPTQRVTCDPIVAWFTANPALARDDSALHALDETCASGHASSCAALAGVTSNQPRVESLRRRACRLGHIPSCGRPSW
jgi:hypothetical protein